MKVLQVAISSLVPYEKNAKKHPQMQIDLLAKNIERFGFTTPVLISEKNEVIAGHGRLLALQQLGHTKVPVVKMEGLSEKDVKALRLADNKVAELGEWDMGLAIEDLRELSNELFDLTGFDADLLLKPDENDDVIPEDVPAKAKLGDLWQLGKHRVLCGDATILEDVERLMDGNKADMVFTDPPYGVSYQSNMRTKSAKFKIIENDQHTLTEWVPLMDVFSKGFVFVWTTWKVLENWMPVLSQLGAMSNMVVWHKGGGGIGDLKGTFSTDYELAMVYNRGAIITGKRIGSVWKMKKDFAGSYKHPTQKPVELATEAMTKTTERDDIVLDLFLGSGSTLIAAQKTGRICYGMELDPKYVDVIVKRWEDYTGMEAILHRT